MDILWLEDSPRDRRLIQEALAGLRDAPTVEFADDGQGFLDRLSEPPHPKLAVLDLRMPGLDGMDILEHLHGHPIVANLPIVLFSGGGVAGEVASGARHHLDIVETVAKPVGLDAFQAAVARIARHAR